VALAIFFVPLFFVLVQRHLARARDVEAPAAAAPNEAS
jgi:hypothetical protein